MHKEPKIIIQSYQIHFPSSICYLNTHIENDHWKDVCAAVSSVSPTSRELAKNLGLKPEDIASIFANFQLLDKDRLSEVIKYWLQWNFNVKKEGKPSWQTLAKAVHPINPSLAESIAQKHKGNLCIYDSLYSNNIIIL